MKTTRTTTLILLLMLLGVGVVFADSFVIDTQRSAQSEAVQTNDRDTEVWSQLPSFMGGIVSQNDTSPINRDALVVDDFESPGDAAITSIEWWGNYGVEVGCLDHFVITVYGHFDHCMFPDEGTVISQQTVTIYNETPIGDDFSYSATVAPILMDTDRKYWLSITAVSNTDVCGNWYWAQSRDTWNCNSRILSAHWGFTNWTSVYEASGYDEEYYAQAFRLSTDGAVADEEMSWGSIKALFK